MRTTRSVPHPGPAAGPHRRWGVIALVLAATFLALYFRRPDQLHHPALWVEEGTIGLPQYLAHGWRFLVEPAAGYAILPSRLIQWCSLLLSFRHSPEISYALTVLFQACVLSTIALAPTTLRHPLACALLTLLIPSDSEVYGSALYAFWWGSLLLVPLLLWRPDAERVLWPRLAMAVLGGLSSPLVLILAPMFLVRAVRVRTANGWIVSAVVLATAAFQYRLLRASGTHGTQFPASLDVAEVVRKFFGMFAWWSREGQGASLTLAIGCMVLAIVGVALLAAWRRIGWAHFVLGGALLTSILISVARMPVEAIHPFLAGPRYFFYPYLFLGWLLVQLAAVSRPALAAALLLPILGSLHQVAAYGPRGHHVIDWRGAVDHCVAEPGTHAMPIHYDGNLRTIWTVPLTSTECRTLRDGGLFP